MNQREQKVVENPDKRLLELLRNVSIEGLFGKNLIEIGKILKDSCEFKIVQLVRKGDLLQRFFGLLLQEPCRMLIKIFFIVRIDSMLSDSLVFLR